MIWTVNTTRNQLVVSTRSLTPLGTLVLKQNDKWTLSLYLTAETGEANAPLTVIPLPAEFTRISVGARSADNLEEADLLFSVTSFTEVGSGQTLHYEAEVNLATASIEAKFPEESTTLRALSALLDIELRNEDGTKRRSVVSQGLVTIHRDIFRGTEGVPLDGDPVYPAPEAIALKAPTDGGYKIDGVNLQLWNATQEIYQTVYLVGTAGAESLVVG